MTRYADSRLEQIERRLLTHSTPSDVQRAMKLLQTPEPLWSDDDQHFMRLTLAKQQGRDSFVQGLGCWLMIIIAAVVVFLLVAR